MPRKLRCFLICEDVEHEQFFSPLLKRRFRRVYVEPRKKQRGGASFVLRNVERLASYVRQRPQEAVALLVVIDGDEAGLQRRLDEIGKAAGFSGAAWEKRIATCIPCRSVETWEIWLCGVREVDEQESYKQAFRREVERGTMSSRRAVEAWFLPLSAAEQQAEESRLPALAHGRREIARLQAFAGP
ncbi:MAG TPA: hypothetical protein VFI63_04715 [Solirubrobacterales bacterium]|nr:hypothetical protein [Solirubrobacterales bacterium]